MMLNNLVVWKKYRIYKECRNMRCGCNKLKKKGKYSHVITRALLMKMNFSSFFAFLLLFFCCVSWKSFNYANAQFQSNHKIKQQMKILLLISLVRLLVQLNAWVMRCLNGLRILNAFLEVKESQSRFRLEKILEY